MRMSAWLVKALGACAPVALALVASMIVIRLAGGPPFEAIAALWAGAVGGPAQIARTLAYVLPLSLVALGWIVAFSTRRINIGFEGQLVMGALAASVVALYVGGLPTVLHLLVATTVAIVAGGLYAGFAAWLWVQRDVNEIISTLMLNFVALEILSWVVRGPLQESGVIFPRSELLPDSARWPTIIPYSALTWDILMVPVLIGAVWFLLNQTTFGAALRITGANPNAARFAGLRTTTTSAVALVISGALAGLAGGSMVLGSESGRLSDGLSANLGFEGIVVALVARNHPAGVLPAALLFAALRSGGGLMESRVGVSAELVLITQGLVILMVAGAGYVFVRYWSWRSARGSGDRDRRDAGVEPLVTSESR